MEEIEKDMTPKLVGETWRKYATETSKQLTTFGLYECQYCGKEWECATQSITTGNTKSCGCQREIWLNRGKTYSAHRFYKKWLSIKNRCYNQNSVSYKDYGARGITVCDEWLNPINFLKWCDSTYIEGLSIDRINNDKGYSPENCRWATREIQNTNQRIRNTNTSGFAGVSWERVKAKWVAYICVNNINKKLGRFKTVEDAVLARDNYIIENGLPHKLSGLTKNEKENK